MYSFFFLRIIVFYQKNFEAKICEILRMFQECPEAKTLKRI